MAFCFSHKFNDLQNRPYALLWPPIKTKKMAFVNSNNIFVTLADESGVPAQFPQEVESEIIPNLQYRIIDGE
ncbi:MAG: hypothetical protein KZQ87_01180 [Candidatus Thiodiazotropha sp. (ex Cardiolucina cf. quadrata)]|nr:hypothetical protein [Candidatus Thiodiazotropha sp. (ex Cardiolucina cf. quadrata)]